MFAAFTGRTTSHADFTAGTWIPTSTLSWAGNDTRGAGGENGSQNTVLARLPTEVAGGGTFSVLSSGHYQSCAIRSATLGLQPSGTLVCWGDNGYGQLGDGTAVALRATPVAVSGTATWSTVATGARSTCAIQATPTAGSLWCWGYNGDGALGIGSTTTSSVPARSGAATTWASVSSNGFHMCALTTGAALYCWGLGNRGQIGNGGTSNVTSPTPIESTATWSSVVTGEYHTCAVAASGSVQGTPVTAGAAYCWGYNNYHQLGTGSSATQLTVPTPVIAAGSTGVRSWASLSGGLPDSCGITADVGDPAKPAGQLWCWGALVPNLATLSDPTQQTGTGWTSVSASTALTAGTCGVLSGAMICSGNNSAGQAGDGTVASPRSPQGQVGAGTYTRAAVGTSHSCGLRSDSRVFCWGSAEFGQLGTGAIWYSSVLRDTNAGTARWASVDVDAHNACAIKLADLYCWGDNAVGQLGLGNTADVGVPTRVTAGAAGWARVDVSTRQGCAIATAGTLWCWGSAFAGSLGTTGGGSTTVPVQVTDTAAMSAAATWVTISVGDASVCGTRSDGTLWCWGYNPFGQLGIGSTSSASRPTRVGTASDWNSVQVSPGGFSCGLRTGGILSCWGSTASGQVGNGSSTGNVLTPSQLTGTWTSYALGTSHVCGIRAAGPLWCWGSNAEHQFGLSGTTSTSTPTAAATPAAGTWATVYAGRSSTCAGQSDGAVYCWGNNYNRQLGLGVTTTPINTPALLPGGPVVTLRLSEYVTLVLR